MPVFNDEVHVGEALSSLLAQDHEDFRIWISDNASTDGSGDICRQIAESDSRVTYRLTERNSGSVWNLNHVFGMGTAPWFMWAASNDRWHPNFVSRCLERLHSDPSVAIVHPEQQYMTHEGEPVGEPFRGYVNLGATIHERWRNTLHCWPLHMAYYGLMRRELAERTRLTLLRDSSDFIFVAEMSLWGQIDQVPEVMFWKRLDPDSTQVRTNDELWTLIGGEGIRRTSKPLVRFDVLRECLRGAKHSGIPADEYRRLVRETAGAYLSPSTRYISMDVKELARKAIGERGYRSYKRLRGGRK